MSDFDWDKAIDQKFNASRNNLIETLSRVIDSVILEKQEQEAINERMTAARDFSSMGSKTLTMSMIPSIPVSEIGWSSVATPESGQEIPSEQRQQLMNFLGNIKGTDLKDKIESLNKFYSGEDSSYMDKETNGQTIAAALSYLTFYKTLTTILTNFNAASAGFSFESFLAVLLEGQQVPTGEGTIADLITGDGTPISLKLYKEGKLEVGGSFTDLSRDLRKSKFNNRMQYVAVTKALAGDGLEQEGNLVWYRFNFTLDNVFNLIAGSSKGSNDLILLPRVFLESNGESLEGVPDKAASLPSAEEMENEYYEYVANYLQNDELMAKIQDQMEEGKEFNFERLKQLLDFAKNDELFTGKKIRGKHSLNKTKLANLLNNSEFIDSSNPDLKGTRKIQANSMLFRVLFNWSSKDSPEVVNQIGGNGANGDLILAHGKSASAEARQQQMKDVYFWGDDPVARRQASVDFYNSASPEMKMRCLEYCYGYVNTRHFTLIQSAIQNIAKLAGDQSEGLFPEGQTQVVIGELRIGATHIQRMLDSVSNRINSSVFDIFDNLEILTSNVQSYFSEGLMDDKKADTAIVAANNIETKTREVAGEEK